MSRISASALFALVLSLLVTPSPARARAYPANACVSKKMAVAAKYCRKALGAWGKWQLDPSASGADARRDAALTKAGNKLSSVWAKAESGAARKNVDCVETTYSAAEAEAALAPAIANLAAEIYSGVDSGSKFDRVCRAKITKAAAGLCSGLLKSESRYIKSPIADKGRARLTAATAAANDKFSSKYDKTVAKASAKGVTCPSTTDGASIAAAASAAVGDAVTNTTVSPNVSTDWTMISPAQAITPYPAKYSGVINEVFPVCSKGTDYVFFVKKGTVNKLVMYYQGGGACWDHMSCNIIGTFDEASTPGDDPGLVSTGFANYDNPLNPFKDWNVVFISYCTGDVHWGDRVVTYGNTGVTRHLGRHNATIAEKWAREHFLDPDEVIATGSSAGGYGAIMNAVPLMEFVYPNAQFSVVADAAHGVITPSWQSRFFPNWGVDKHKPDYIPGLEASVTELTVAELWASIANHYPQHRFAHYTTAYDGGFGGQSSFYQIMLNPDNVLAWTSWWAPTCEWNSLMRQIGFDVSAAAPNYRYYIGAGNRHTAWGSDKVYTDTSGAVPTLVDWVNDMLVGAPGWVNVECSDCSLIATCQGGTNAGLSCADDLDCPSGSCEADEEPSPLAAPYVGGGVVSCP
ncbi:MAG: pectin acetylesterase-family hydrolase [Candidatus Binatia bacterium]